MRHWTWILLAVWAAVLSGCAGYRPAGNAVHQDLVAPYRVDSGDRLRIIVFGQNDLSNTYTVDKAGMISMPLIGSLPVRGREPNEIADAVTTLLSRGYVRVPDVSVEVDRYRPFYAMGEVNSAGQYAYVAGMTVQSAIAVAGGFTPRAEESSVDVTRSGYGAIATLHLRMTDPLMPGDTIYVRERLF
jgi:polysaccharide export outer membrane protein